MQRPRKVSAVARGGRSRSTSEGVAV